MKDNKREFLEFLTQSELPPKGLRISTQKDILLTFHKKSILSKFLFFQFLGACFTLFFCPQFGIGFVDGHGIAHIFRMIGDWACAAFCGSLFLSAGMVISYIGMKGEELWWVWKHYRYTLVLLPAFMWSSLMLMNISFESHNEAISYHLTWILSAILAQTFWMSLRSTIYKRTTLVQDTLHS
jgi:hypothetical protein